MQEKISLAGDLGSGKSTVSSLLVGRLGAEYYSTGAIVRRIAERRGMSVVELNIYMETHPEIDREIDDGLRRLSDEQRGMIIDSRMAWHFTRGTFRVYLSCDMSVSACRIMCAGRKGDCADRLDEMIEQVRARRESERKRYHEKYGVNIKDLTNYDLIVDTTYATPEQVAAAVADGFEIWRRNPDYRAALICPARLSYPDDPADGDEVQRRADILDTGGNIPPVSVQELDGEFYVVSEPESALAYSLSDMTFVPCTLLPGTPSGSFVKMKNSL